MEKPLKTLAIVVYCEEFKIKRSFVKQKYLFSEKYEFHIVFRRKFCPDKTIGLSSGSLHRFIIGLS